MKKRIVSRMTMVLLGVGLMLVLSACAPLLGFLVPNEYEVAGNSGTLRNVILYDKGPGPDGGTYVGIALVTGSLDVQSDGRLDGEGDVIYIEVLAEESDLSFMDRYDWDSIDRVGELVGGFVYVQTVYDGTDFYTYGSYTQLTGGTAFVRRPLIGDMVITIDADTQDGLLTATYRGESVETGLNYTPVDLNPSVLSGQSSGSETLLMDVRK